MPPGVLGSAGPTLVRTNNSQPIAGTMRFSIDFFNSGDITEDVILHEMAHAMGFGTVSVEKKEKAETGAGIMLINNVAHVCYDIMNRNGGCNFYFNGCR